ncbi:Immunoglobulin-like fold,CBM21 (carbohydrate binding type-21) domain [Cinara cedri]|uniref:Immunoglobulin-like fold,CBM21 (Carbohydrate binding type-21) domain n=1 Tax=Cinara cedri TaxID=506608 RepID=A0A5E4NPU8_9HEMI|nr:Immunoglobulin-like fold,CBM21 (carbohydrate binding type-21) domain [Cinara cedri]
MSSECCDVIVAHSPPIFTGHRSSQPNLQTCLLNNMRLVITQKPSPVPARRFVSSNSRGSSGSQAKSADNKLLQADQPGPGSVQTSKPRRPCLVRRADSDGSFGSSSSSSSSSSCSSSDENEPPSPTRRKKKVVFADDRGLSLTQVRLMNEPSNQPPKLLTVQQYLNQQSAAPAMGAGVALNKHMADQLWHLRFSQPASNYLDFRNRLDTNNISLENVIVKWPDHRVVGTVKVRNLSYDKEVFVRYTEDRWVTHRDALCTYVQQNITAMNANGSCSVAPAPVQNIYDTFSFCLQLPTSATAMEFAVCYKNVEFECWDNNDNKNYCVSVSGHGVPTGPLLQQLQEQNSPSAAADANSAVIEYDHQHRRNSRQHHQHQQKSPVHFFGAQSKQNSWNTWRDQKIDTSAYW